MAFQSIKEYQINTAGSSNGLVIPSGFRIAVMPTAFTPVQNDAAVDFTVEMQVCTYVDDQHTAVIPNDNVASRMSYNINEETIAQDIRTLVGSLIKPDLDAFYGTENVQVIT